MRVSLAAPLLALACGAPAVPALVHFPPQETRTPMLAVHSLRCEHEREPLDVETPAPRFSWKLETLDPDVRRAMQKGFQLLVASTPAHLARDEGDLWDCTQIPSRETVDVPYAGRPLRAFEHAWWKVRVRGDDGTSSAWSEPAHFAMGALAAQDWRATWIGFDAPRREARPPPDLEGARWLRTASGTGELWLRARFELAPEELAKAVLVLAGVDEYEAYLNGAPVLRRAHAAGATRQVEVALVGEHLRAGANSLAVRVRRAGPGPAAVAAKLYLRPGKPEARTIASTSLWRVTAGAARGFERPEHDDASWSEAAELTEAELDALPALELPAIALPPPRLLRGEFRARPELARATLHASALGTYSLELNGQRVGADWFAPGWTDYAKRIPYRAYDVTALVRAGDNVLGVVLADGWYAGYLGKRGKRDNYGTDTRFLGQLVLDFADGSRELVTSDTSWRASVGPWREADLYMGERYDARAELPGWSAPGFDDSGWKAVDTSAPPAAPLTAHDGAEIRVSHELAPVAVTPRDGKALLDFGQNLAGVVRLALEAPAGTHVLLRFGEGLEADGSLWRKNLGWARSTDVYVCKGGGRETWEPRFTYHGFRYVEVSGLPAVPDASMFTALALSSASEPAGEFRCSDPRVDRLVELARWTLRANSMDVPTDCPQRGERLGWTGDGQLFAPSALWLADLGTLYSKWSRDLLDAQRSDGKFPATAPSWENVAPGGPAWADAGVLVPARLFEVYGDRRLVERQLDSMRRFLDACAREAGPSFSWPESIQAFGDWNTLGPATPPELLACAYFVRSARRLAELERALGHAAEAEQREAQVAAARTAFARDWIDGEGRLRASTQTALALALVEELLPDEPRAQAASALRADLAANGLRAGFVGVGEILPALTRVGAAADAYRLLRARSFPSWGYLLDQGATTLWERWDAWTPERGYANESRVSLAHTPFGSFVAWLFEGVAGITPAKPGFRSVAFAPRPGGGLSWAEASYESVRGRLALRWELVAGELVVEVELPPNVLGTLALSSRSPDSIREEGAPAGEPQGVLERRSSKDGVVLELAPGRYRFRCPDPILAE